MPEGTEGDPRGSEESQRDSSERTLRVLSGLSKFDETARTLCVLAEELPRWGNSSPPPWRPFGPGLGRLRLQRSRMGVQLSLIHI